MVEVAAGPLGGGPSEPIEISLEGEALPWPECDDDNECTDDSFDPASGACVHETHTRR